MLGRNHGGSVNNSEDKQRYFLAIYGNFFHRKRRFSKARYEVPLCGFSGILAHANFISILLNIGGGIDWQFAALTYASTLTLLCFLEGPE